MDEGSPTKPLWLCPRCGRRFANRRQPHSCGAYTVEGFLEGKPASGRALFQAFEGMVRRCGPVELAPAKTRVGFQVRMIFAAVNGVGEHGIDVHLVLPRRIDSPRFRRIETLGRRSHVHHLRISSMADLDEELRLWLEEAYGVGRQDGIGRVR